VDRVSTIVLPPPGRNGFPSRTRQGCGSRETVQTSRHPLRCLPRRLGGGHRRGGPVGVRRRGVHEHRGEPQRQQLHDRPRWIVANAVQLQQQACTSAASQNFTFNPVAGTADTYTISTLTAGKCVDVNGASTADNATIIQWTCHSNNNQRWRLVPIVVTGRGQDVPADRRAVRQVHRAVRWLGRGEHRPVPAAVQHCVEPDLAAGQLHRRKRRHGQPFTNPLSLHGPDPYLTYYNGNYYLVTTTWNMTITMRRSPTLAGLKTASDVVVMNLGSFPNACCNMWAPEIHLLTGPNGQRWYLYFTAGQNIANYLGTQRIHVLESSGLDPMGPYTFKADMLDPTQNNTWELDGSILQLNGQLYLMGTFYNGSQPAFIRPLSNPWTASGTRHILVNPTLSWETVGGAVAEGPEALQHNGRTFVIYSASHCSTPDYKMGMLTYNGGDPLLSSSWVKSDPVFQRSNANSVYGPATATSSSRPVARTGWPTTPTPPPAVAAT
jgi:GH43 family beta-xylosidase